MKMKLGLILSLLILAVSPALTQTWVKVATEADTLTFTSAAPITVRYGAASGTTYAGVNCAAATANCWVTTTLKSATNLSLSDAGGNLFGVPDPAPGVAKELDVQQGPAAIPLTVSGKLITVPALIPTTYPPIAFTPGVSYTITGTSVQPATATAPLTVGLTISIGSVSVPLSCPYVKTLANGLPVFTCIPAAIAGK